MQPATQACWRHWLQVMGGRMLLANDLCEFWLGTLFLTNGNENGRSGLFAIHALTLNDKLIISALAGLTLANGLRSAEGELIV